MTLALQNIKTIHLKMLGHSDSRRSQPSQELFRTVLGGGSGISTPIPQLPASGGHGPPCFTNDTNYGDFPFWR